MTIIRACKVEDDPAGHSTGREEERQTERERERERDGRGFFISASAVPPLQEQNNAIIILHST